MPQPVVHHVEMCVGDTISTLKRLLKYGFQPFAKRTTPVCKQLVCRLGNNISFVITERNTDLTSFSRDSTSMTTLCCESKNVHEIDSVFNIAFQVSDVPKITENVRATGGHIIQDPTIIGDEFGEMRFSIIKSECENVMHTLIDCNSYTGPFLVGFEAVDEKVDDYGLINYEESVPDINYIDHVTLATYPGNSLRIIEFYERCFGMTRFSITSNMDDLDNGLVLSDGVGLRLRAMEYYRCAETGLVYPSKRERTPNSVMLVIVESLEGQINCNIDTFLREHQGPGVEHIGMSSSNITKSVPALIERGVLFRKPPAFYYDELRRSPKIKLLEQDLDKLKELGILLDNEGGENEKDPPKYLMQIFATPFFDRKTFFIEVIHRIGAVGLGAGNIIALVKSIREEEKRKNASKTLEKEEMANPRKVY